MDILSGRLKENLAVNVLAYIEYILFHLSSVRWLDNCVIGYFWHILASNFLARVAQTFGDFGGNFENGIF